ncbi:hypothetical protein Tco_0686353 [Tanacetum coccineum]
MAMKLVGDGSMIRFWKDTWLGDAPLCNGLCGVGNWRRPVKVGELLQNFNNLIMDMGSFELVRLARDCVVSSLSTDGSYSCSFSNMLDACSWLCELKSDVIFPVRNETYRDTPSLKLQKV